MAQQAGEQLALEAYVQQSSTQARLTCLRSGQQVSGSGLYLPARTRVLSSCMLCASKGFLHTQCERDCLWR